MIRRLRRFFVPGSGSAGVNLKSDRGDTMKHRTLVLCAAAALLSGPAAVQAAGDADAGKAKAATCAGCHGPKGIAIAPNYPNLAGQKEQYLADSMKAYRDGGRDNPIMKPMVSALSDEDIANLAAYYASLPPQ
jgi:cytochrome c553